MVDFDYVEDQEKVDAEAQLREQLQTEQGKHFQDVDEIKSYLKDHPESWGKILEDYRGDVDALLDSAGMARPLVENALRGKLPWLWDALYPDGNGTGAPAKDKKPQTDRGRDRDDRGSESEEDEEGYDTEDDYDYNSDDWRNALELAIDLRKDRIPPAKISDKILELYGIDIHPTQVGKLINEYLLDRKADAHVPRMRQDSPGSSRTRDNTLGVVQTLLDKNKALESKILDLKKPQAIKKVGLIRWLWSKLY